MSKKFYIVGGYSTDNHTHYDWYVAGYDDLEKARIHAQKATDRAIELMDKIYTIDEFGMLESEDYTANRDNVYDPKMFLCWKETYYTVIEIDSYHDIAEFMLKNPLDE